MTSQSPTLAAGHDSKAGIDRGVEPRADAGAALAEELRNFARDPTKFGIGHGAQLCADAANQIDRTPALPAAGEVDDVRDDNALWALASTLHENMPEDKRPMSWSDFSPEQIERLQRAANNFLAALDLPQSKEAGET